jgi:hypothetical protein
MRPLSLIVALCLAGCGGADHGGDVDLPDGYVGYSAEGVSFVHPRGWRPTTRSLGHGITEVRFEDPDARGGAAISLTTQRMAAGRFERRLEDERSVLEGAGGAQVTREDVDVPGAIRAVRSTIESPGASSEALDLLMPGGRHLALAAGAPAGRRGVLDAAAVIASLRVRE